MAHRWRVVEFAVSLSLLMVLGAGPAVVEDAMLRLIWDLIMHIARLRASVNFKFVFSHCGVPRNEPADKAAKQGNAKPQPYPARAADMSLAWGGRCGTRNTGPPRRVGCHARVAVCYSITFGQHRSTPS
ncbi:hypothetical protein ERJ75_001592000 [Trypanosoma vivax]|nr:hypothetical protein ERJ75_001592000 [Trypanosoma vivax]